MFYLSLPTSLMIFIIFSVPFYIAISAWSFKYFSIKANSSPAIIENFKKQLHSPIKLIFRGSPSIITRLVGEDFANHDLHEAQFQRILILIVFSSFHIPLFIGFARLISSQNLFQASLVLIIIVFSLTTTFVCFRFGQKLLNNTER